MLPCLQLLSKKRRCCSPHWPRIPPLPPRCRRRRSCRYCCCHRRCSRCLIRARKKDQAPIGGSRGAPPPLQPLMTAPAAFAEPLSLPWPLLPSWLPSASCFLRAVEPAPRRRQKHQHYCRRPLDDAHLAGDGDGGGDADADGDGEQGEGAASR